MTAADNNEAALLAAQQERDNALGLAALAAADWRRAEATVTRLREALEAIRLHSNVAGFVNETARAALAQDAEQENA